MSRTKVVGRGRTKKYLATGGPFAGRELVLGESVGRAPVGVRVTLEVTVRGVTGYYVKHGARAEDGVRWVETGRAEA